MIANANSLRIPLANNSVDTIITDPPYGLKFMGSGSTGCAAVQEGRKFIGLELNAEYTHIAQRRVDYWELEHKNDMPLFGASYERT